jgi:hypothetical protein
MSSKSNNRRLPSWQPVLLGVVLCVSVLASVVAMAYLAVGAEPQVKPPSV